jgi:Carboxypeptidase regulatory-like domain/TonB-dependent Receptor Plug Domain
MRTQALVLSRILAQALLASGVLSAQWLAAQTGGVRGLVLDSTQAPVPEVAVAVVAAHQVTRTDQQGRFSLSKLPPGDVEFSIRRIGFQPATLKRTIPANDVDTFTVVLAELPQALDAMSVTERHHRQGVEEFYFRRAQGLSGVFFTRDDISNQRASTPSDLMRTTPGVRLVRVGSGKGVRFPGNTGIRRGDCQPVVWLDGQSAPGMELDDIPLHDIEGIELYRGVSNTPGQFWRAGASQCGAIVVWTRVPGTP